MYGHDRLYNQIKSISWFPHTIIDCLCRVSRQITNLAQAMNESVCSFKHVSLLRGECPLVFDKALHKLSGTVRPEF